MILNIFLTLLLPPPKLCQVQFTNINLHLIIRPILLLFWVFLKLFSPYLFTNSLNPIILSPSNYTSNPVLFIFLIVSKPVLPSFTILNSTSLLTASTYLILCPFSPFSRFKNFNFVFSFPKAPFSQPYSTYTVFTWKRRTYIPTNKCFFIWETSFGMATLVLVSASLLQSSLNMLAIYL